MSVFDFPDYLYTDLRSGVVPSEFESLRAVYRQFLLPQSADFIHSCSSASIVFAMARHGLLHKTSCGRQHAYVNMLVEHFLAGMCASNNGPLCRSYVQACHKGGIRPPVFFLSALQYTSVLSTISSPALMLFWCFLAPSKIHNKRERTLHALARRLTLLRYLPYKGEVTYMAAMFDSTFETLHRNELLLMMDAHGITASTTSLTVDDIRELLSDHVF